MEFPNIGDKVQFLKAQPTGFDYDVAEGYVTGVGLNQYGHKCVQLIEGENRLSVELLKLDTSEENKIKIIDVDMQAKELLELAKKDVQELINARDAYNQESKAKLDEMQAEIEAGFEKRNEQHNELYHELFGVHKVGE